MGIGKGALLWLIGTPIPIIILLMLFWRQFCPASQRTEKAPIFGFFSFVRESARFRIIRGNQACTFEFSA